MLGIAVKKRSRFFPGNHGPSVTARGHTENGSGAKPFSQIFVEGPLWLLHPSRRALIITRLLS